MKLLVEKVKFYEPCEKSMGQVFTINCIGHLCLMGNHFHLVIQMHPDTDYSDTEIARRFALYYLNDEECEGQLPGQLPAHRSKWVLRTIKENLIVRSALF